MTRLPIVDDDNPHSLAPIRELWRELQTVRNDPEKYRSIVQRIRKEAERHWQRDYAHKRES